MSFSPVVSTRLSIAWAWAVLPLYAAVCPLSAAQPCAPYALHVHHITCRMCMRVRACASSHRPTTGDLFFVPLLGDVIGTLANYNWIKDLADALDAPFDNLVNSNVFPLPQVGTRAACAACARLHACSALPVTLAGAMDAFSIASC